MSNIFTDLFSTKPAENAARDKQAGFAAGNTAVNDALNAGQASADATYDKAAVPFSTLYSTGINGTNTYADATGANGAEGIARAGSLYKSMPGYSGGLDTGIEAARRAGILKDGGGGNTAGDIIKFASDYDASKYGNFVSNLAPWLGQAQGAAAGQAGVLGAKAGADLGVAGTKATTGWNALTGASDAQAQADVAPYSASQNFWSSLMGAGQLALKASGVGGFAPVGKAA